ncbi:hypothetical protein VNI00_011165 [Paramarasmius palmivorus]|uniref:Uncharacterized protein n=1 Tax=Paramarasmius palmivorus TaxID=297713 RepID=A0AAW0CEY2_9AGAR
MSDAQDAPRDGSCHHFFVDPRSGDQRRCSCPKFTGSGKNCTQCSHSKASHPEDTKPKAPNKAHLFQPKPGKRKKDVVVLKGRMQEVVENTLKSSGISQATILAAKKEAHKGISAASSSKGEGSSSKAQRAPSEASSTAKETLNKKGPTIRYLVCIPFGANIKEDGQIVFKTIRAPTPASDLAVFQNLGLVVEFPEGTPFDINKTHEQTKQWVKSNMPVISGLWSVLGWKGRCGYDLVWGYETYPTTATMWDKRGQRSKSGSEIVYLGTLDQISPRRVKKFSDVATWTNFISIYKSLYSSFKVPCNLTEEHFQAARDETRLLEGTPYSTSRGKATARVKVKEEPQQQPSDQEAEVEEMDVEEDSAASDAEIQARDQDQSAPSSPASRMPRSLSPDSIPESHPLTPPPCAQARASRKRARSSSSSSSNDSEVFVDREDYHLRPQPKKTQRLTSGARVPANSGARTRTASDQTAPTSTQAGRSRRASANTRNDDKDDISELSELTTEVEAEDDIEPVHASFTALAITPDTKDPWARDRTITIPYTYTQPAQPAQPAQPSEQ